jgi:hypothetical protein
MEITAEGGLEARATKGPDLRSPKVGDPSLALGVRRGFLRLVNAPQGRRDDAADTTNRVTHGATVMVSLNFAGQEKPQVAPKPRRPELQQPVARHPVVVHVVPRPYVAGLTSC